MTFSSLTRSITQACYLFVMGMMFTASVFAAPARFDVSVSPNPLKVSEFADVTIKALSSNGTVDTSYGGDIWIEVEGFDYTDPDLVLPGGGIGFFEATDQGIKIFSKGLSVKTPGTYTLSVADVYDTAILGTTEITILADSDGPAVGDITVVSPVAGSIEKSATVDVIGSTTFANTPIELFIDGTSTEDGLSDASGNFTFTLSGLAPGEHVLKINAKDLEEQVVATSGDIPFTYEVEAGDLFLGLDIEPGKEVFIDDKLTFTIRTAPRVTSAFLRVGEGDELPTEKVSPGIFRKQLALSQAGVYMVDVRLLVDGNAESFDDIDQVTVKEDVKKILSLDYTTDDARKEANLSWTYTGTIEHFKINYGLNKNNMRLSLRTVVPQGMLVLADPTLPYYVQVFPVDAQDNVIGDPSDIITIPPVAPKAPVCGDNKIEGAEECDDGNTLEGDGCNAVCRRELPKMPVCGNGEKEGFEQCDDGNVLNGDGCNAVCSIEVASPPPPPQSVCGNGIIESGETCDDGNVLSSDGCDYRCIIEPQPQIPTCYPDGITIGTKKVGDAYYLHWAPVPQAQGYIIYRSDQSVTTIQQMTVISRTQETMFEYPFDIYSEVDKWAWYAVEAICPDEAQKQVGDVTAVKVGPEKTLLLAFLASLIAFMGWRLSRVAKV